MLKAVEGNKVDICRATMIFVMISSAGI